MKVPNRVTEDCILDLNEIQAIKKDVDKKTSEPEYLIEMTFKNGLKETIYYADEKRRDEKFKEFDKLIFQSGGYPAWAKEQAEKAKEIKHNTRGNRY